MLGLKLNHVSKSGHRSYQMHSNCNYYVTMTSHERHNVLNHQQLGCLYRLFRLIPVTGSSLTKGKWCEKCFNVMTSSCSQKSPCTRFVVEHVWYYSLIDFHRLNRICWVIFTLISVKYPVATQDTIIPLKLNIQNRSCGMRLHLYAVIKSWMVYNSIRYWSRCYSFQMGQSHHTRLLAVTAGYWLNTAWCIIPVTS